MKILKSSLTFVLTSVVNKKKEDGLSPLRTNLGQVVFRFSGQLPSWVILEIPEGKIRSQSLIIVF